MIKEIMDIFKRSQKFKKIENPTVFGGQRSHRKIEDISYVRNVQEKLASIEVGQQFGLATREGIRVFKLIEIRPNKENQNKNT